MTDPFGFEISSPLSVDMIDAALIHIDEQYLPMEQDRRNLEISFHISPHMMAEIFNQSASFGISYTPSHNGHPIVADQDVRDSEIKVFLKSPDITTNSQNAKKEVNGMFEWLSSKREKETALQMDVVEEFFQNLFEKEIITPASSVFVGDKLMSVLTEKADANSIRCVPGVLTFNGCKIMADSSLGDWTVEVLDPSNLPSGRKRETA